MGEIADDMINGFVCAMCGVFLDGDEPGFPRYCSTECADDQGADHSLVIDTDEDEDEV
jgi:hypothetical protein